MQQAIALPPRGQGGRLGPQFARLLHHRRAAWCFTLLAVAGLAQFVSFFAIATTYPERLSRTGILISFTLSVVVALAVTIYVYRTQRETFFDPPEDRVPRKKWHRFANKRGLLSLWSLPTRPS
jgi:NADH:ubiquinone oxidoreductase subunit 5 (subunit L)/multisubunit Na+/H+ antiporter MnhA subunit